MTGLLPITSPRTGSLAQGAEQGARQGMVLEPPLRMPLHADGEAARLPHRHRFDQPVRCQRLDRQSIHQPGYTLAVQ